MILPTIWAVIGTFAVFAFGVYEDLMLVVSAGAAGLLTGTGRSALAA